MHHKYLGCSKRFKDQHEHNCRARTGRGHRSDLEGWFVVGEDSALASQDRVSLSLCTGRPREATAAFLNLIATEINPFLSPPPLSIHSSPSSTIHDPLNSLFHPQSPPNTIYLIPIRVPYLPYTSSLSSLQCHRGAMQRRVFALREVEMNVKVEI
ncbi:hypothetical protein ONZ45_g11954 [Pleurotus djamor]|nr:hypothetical protein ONZ45_g11954 [Pleurotus djamor]